jgi:thioredoxin
MNSPVPAQQKAATSESMAVALADGPLDALLASSSPAFILISGDDDPRSDARTEFDKAAAAYGKRITFVRISSASNPAAAARFEVARHPVAVAWVNGALMARRNRPWGTDIKGMVDDMLKVVPEEPVGTQKIVKAVKAPVKVTDATFQAEVIDSELPVVIDFWAEWCGPCKKIGPVLEKLAGEYAGKLIVAKVNTDENPGLSQYFRIESIPTLMFVKDRKIYDQVAGAYPEPSLRQMFDAFLAA